MSRTYSGKAQITQIWELIEISLKNIHVGKKNMGRWLALLVFWKMQVKVPRRYQFIPTTMVIMKHSENNKHLGYRKTGSPVHY